MWCYDPDGDGFGGATALYTCIAPANFVSVGGDCNDTNASIHPGMVEVCNTIDDNCNGLTDEGFDLDNDGFTSCQGDCNDANALVYPGALELCNGTDEDCDNLIDEGFDQDNDGFTVCAGDCDDNNANVNPNQQEICNNIDDNCNGLTDEGFDMDNDGFTTCEGDCDDFNNAVYPGATEVCNNIDDDCDGSTDEGLLTTYYLDADGDGFGLETSTVQACELPTGYANVSGDCNDNNGAVNPNATEICGNGIDDDCDGTFEGDQPYINCPNDTTIACDATLASDYHVFNGCGFETVEWIDELVEQNSW